MKRTITIIILCLNFVLISAQYDRIGNDYGNGLRRVEKGNYYGFIDANGKVVVPLKYFYLDEFTNGKTRVVAGFDEVKSEYERDRKYGMIDKFGRTIIPFKYDFVGYDYGNGLRKVTIRNASKTEYGTDDLSGFINENGKEVIPLNYRILDDFSDEKKVVYAEKPGDVDENGSYGYLIDKNGTHAFPYKTDDKIGNNGIFIVKNEKGLKGLVDSKNQKILIVPSYWFLWYPCDGMLRVATDYEKCGFLDGKTYKMVIQPQYENVGDFSEGLAAVAQNDKVGFINKRGDVVIPFVYENNNPNLYTFAYGLCAVSKVDSKYAIINNKGEELTPYIYGYIYDSFAPMGFEANVLDQKGVKHYFDHNGVKYDTKEERDIAQFEIIKKRALNGDERYYAALATIYSDDAKCRELGMTSKDDKLAFNWYLKAANSTIISFYKKYDIYETDIYYQIGLCYEKGIGTEINIDEAKLWYAKSAKLTGRYGMASYAHYRLEELGRDMNVNPIPIPKPTKDYATISWFAFQDKTTQEEYQLKLGIKSDSKIESVTITVNGIQDRGIKTVNSSDYDLTINRTLSLNEGANIIKVSVKNAAGTAQEEKNIVYRPQGGELPSIEWLDFVATANKKEYQMKLGIKSKSKVEEVNVTVNGALSRGIKTVASDGFDLTVDRTLSLSEGLNRIVVSVRNGDGISTSEKVITYQGNNPMPVFNDKRIAFVIGNSHYSNSEMNLANPENDAKDVAEKLKGLGFEVVLKLDATKENMERELSSFGEKAKDYDVAMFYYAGHGIQSKGVNYLIPTNIDDLAENNLKWKCVNIEQVLDVMEDSQCKLKIVVLDACRNDPVSRKWHRSTATRGLSIMSSPIGTIIAYSTAPGMTAQDGTGRNSPYTEAFLNTLDQPNLDISNFFQEVMAHVTKKTHQSQNPWWSSSYTGKFYFNKQ